MQHTQQSRLYRHRHVAHFVEKQRAFVGLADQADAAFLVGPGEGASFIAKQLGLDQFGRDRCTVDRDQRLAGTRTGLMQGFDKHFLADPGFTMNEQRDVFFQQPLGLTHSLLDFRIAQADGLQVKVS